MPEQRMLLLDIGTGGMRRTHLKPRRVPEYGQVRLFYITAQRHASGSRKQYRSTLLQYFQSMGIECIGHIQFGVVIHLIVTKTCLLRIDPEIPMILDNISHLDMKSHLGRLFDRVERELHHP